MRKELDTTNKDNTNKVMDLASKPNSSGQSITMATMATTGMVKPMLAMAEPMAKF